MVKLTNNFNVGDRQDLSSEYLLYLIETMYRDIVNHLNQKPSIIRRNTDGLTTDTTLSIGDININTVTLNTQMLVDFISVGPITTAVWQNI